jgi:hypothetical protein
MTMCTVETLGLLEVLRRGHHVLKWVWIIVVTYSQFDSNIRVLYVFLGFLKNT